MEAKRPIWLEEFLIPFIVNKEKVKLQQRQSVNDVQLKSFEVKEFSSEGVLFTICYTIKIILDVDGRKRPLAVFVKVTPELNEDMYDAISFDEKFQNETTAYEKILPLLNPSVNFPTFYYSHAKKMDGVVAISDFSADGYSMSKSLVNLSMDHILISMKTIGKFHGASFAMKHNHRSQFDAMRMQLIDALFKERAAFKTTMRNGCTRATNSFRKTANDSDVVTESFLQDIEKLFCEELVQFLRAKYAPKEPLAIICHGDFLRNNIAFKYDNDGLATDAMLFDFQTVRYASPMLDLCLFMAISTGYEIRQKYFDEIFRTYYDAVIAEYLKKTNLNGNDVPDFMSYTAFLKEYTLHLPFGFHSSCFFLPQMVQPTEKLLENFKKTGRDSVLIQGGDVVDRETRGQIIDMYKFYKQFDLKLLDYQ